jgi:predicted lipoprotein with Yx(FWY)xxD motif
MRRTLNLALVLLLSASPAALAAETLRNVIPAEREAYHTVPMPPGFRVEHTELEGPVFADSRGMTLYTWPHDTLRNGVTGDSKKQSDCTDEKTTHTAGLMSPYPAGLELPDLDKRVACTTEWPPAFAPDDAKPAGDFTLIIRKDGRKQWAYDESALYTSRLDKVPGDVLGGTTRESGGGNDGPATRRPAQAPSAIPAGFAMLTTTSGRQLLTDKNFSVYMSDRDGPNKSNCDEQCARTWVPMLAPASAQPRGEWSVFERAPGVYQWAFRKRPLYSYSLDYDIRSLKGSDEAGWHNVYLQKTPAPPKHFTAQETLAGIVLADENGKTIYTYNCGDDSKDQLACDHPGAPQQYRLAICGGGDAARCLKTWPYVTAAADAKPDSRSWSIITIDPMTGLLAAADAPGALRVWAYRDRPIYTYARDLKAGDTFGVARGEHRGRRNGFTAFWVRDDYFGNTY